VYETGPCFETRTGTKLGPEPEPVFLQIMLLGEKKVALNQLQTFRLNYEIMTFSINFIMKCIDI
jgi:hypothetical protein